MNENRLPFGSTFSRENGPLGEGQSFFASEEKKNHFTFECGMRQKQKSLNMCSIFYRDVANPPISTIAIKTDWTWISANEHLNLEVRPLYGNINRVATNSCRHTRIGCQKPSSSSFVRDKTRSRPNAAAQSSCWKDVPEACVVLVEDWERRAKRRRSLTEEEHA